MSQELIDKIVCLTDLKTQVKLYTTNDLQTIVSPCTFRMLEPVILAHFQAKHQRLLDKCLSCLKYHVWDDGTSIKTDRCVRSRSILC